MNEAAIQDSLTELKEVLCEGAGRRAAWAEGLYLPSNPGRRPALQETVDHLRMAAKYLVFDLEATRRENRYLRKMLETHLRQERDNDSDGQK